VESVFLLNQTVKGLLLYLIQYGNGLLVRHGGVRVNYTRKINHFALFFIPMYLDRVFAYENSLGLFVLGSCMVIITLAIYVKPLRERVPFIATMFLSFDRPEDRPRTLLWLSTQITTGFLVIIPMIILFAQQDLLDLVLIPILINGIGDGLAEPVGVRFGKHTYEVYALFTDKKYLRSLEGSACVFITSILVVAFHFAYFTQPQFIVALIALPFLMTLAEALAPHTWDTPFLFFVGYSSLFLISLI
jgi:dolichol kinase